MQGSISIAKRKLPYLCNKAKMIDLQALLNLIITTLKSIPGVIWSGLIASVLTLGGVLIANRSNTNRLTLQLQHDATEKSKERTATLRRDIYLQTTEELTKVSAHLAGLPQLDFTKTNLAEGMQGFFSAAARLQLVAESQTTLLVNALVGEYAELILRLLTHFSPVHNAKSNIQIADNFYNNEQSEITRILSEISKLNESGTPASQVFCALESSFNFHKDQANKYSRESNLAWEQYNQHNLAFQKYLLIQLRDISSKQIPVLIALRKDLGFTSNLIELEEQMQRQWTRIESQFNALISSFEEE